MVRKDAREKEKAPHSSILAWEIPWTEEPGGLQFGGWWGWAVVGKQSQELDTIKRLHHHHQVLLLPQFYGLKKQGSESLSKS